MTYRATITLDDDVYLFLESHAGKNRSAFINALIKKELALSLADRIIKANHEEATDAEYQEALEAWDVTMMDGLPR